jgi:2-succinyl-5-enolpyruvyl-6-hydroxy-3-cyclohexene-1-carboxylate synthase
MIAAHKNVRILISLLKQYNIRHFVISPGSRNMPLVKSVEDDSFFTCYSVVDERSAAYFAVGLSLEVRSPVALTCTSAQATRNYIPGMTEAFYRKAPVLAITSDYDQSFIGQQNMQALAQMNMPTDAANVSVDVAIVKDQQDEQLAVRNLNLALDALTRSGGGAVHINIRIGAHWERGADELETYRKITRYVPSDLKWPALDDRKILVVIGQHHPFSKSEKEAVEAFADKYNAAFYVNHISNYNGLKSVHGNLRLKATPFGQLEPDLLITIGGHLGDYPLDGKLRNLKVEHWRVSADGQYADTYNLVTKVFECSDAEFFQRMADSADESFGDLYFQQWASECGRVSLPDDYPLSHATVAQKLSPLVPASSNLHFAILNSMRVWEMFNIDPSIRSYSNVAGFGIDGCLSTFLGQSIASEQLNFLIIGDLSFFYDMNSIGIRQLKNNIRIVLVNNHGGCEFRLKSHAADNFGDDSNRHIAAAGHFGESAEGWVRNNGFEYFGVQSDADLVQAAERFMQPSDKPILMEVFTEMEDDSKALEAITMHIDQTPQSKKLVNSIKRRIPKGLKKGIKGVMKGLE